MNDTKEGEKEREREREREKTIITEREVTGNFFLYRLFFLLLKQRKLPLISYLQNQWQNQWQKLYISIHA
jgi:hypothetical protein